MSAASYRNIRDRRSVLLSGSISHRPALVERLYWLPQPLKRERSKPPNAAGCKICSVSVSMAKRSGYQLGMQRAPRWRKRQPRFFKAPAHARHLQGNLLRLCARGVEALKAVAPALQMRSHLPSVLVGVACLWVFSAHEALCHQRLPDSLDRAHRAVAPHALAYAPISADVHRAVSCGEFREDIQEDFEVQ